MERGERARLWAEQVDELQSLPGFAAALGRCRVLVTNDTGGMHLANALGVAVIGLFGPTNPLRTGPVFNAPWEAQAFAMAVELHRRGVFTWREWADALAEEIAHAVEHGDRDDGSHYYERWLAADVFAPDGAGSRADDAKPPFVVIQPPPNVTGSLHLGHAQRSAVEDLMVRHARMCGRPTLWLPGLDHASIAAQFVLDRLKEEARHRTLIDAIVTSMRTTGAAILFTATTIFAGIIFWITISTLRFNGEMSLLLCLLLQCQHSVLDIGILLIVK